MPSAAKRGIQCADGYLQHELEASFLYEDTPDQLTATEAVKKDMEGTIPMDRLICGDVGFGKTEIAIRAAFKQLPMVSRLLYYPYYCPCLPTL